MNAITTYKEILANVKQMLRLPNSDNDIFLVSLIETGARDLGTTETLIMKDCMVTVENNKFHLPDDCKDIVAGRSKNSCIPAVFVNVPFFKRCGCNTMAFPTLVNVIDINGRWANLINKVEDGTQIEIAYQAVWTDEHGDIVINEEMYTALTMYACYWFAMAYAENYTPEQRRSWGTKYEYQAQRCRSLASRRTYEDEKQQIRSVMIQMVNSASPWGTLSAQWNSFFYPTIRST